MYKLKCVSCSAIMSLTTEHLGASGCLPVVQNAGHRGVGSLDGAEAAFAAREKAAGARFVAAAHWTARNSTPCIDVARRGVSLEQFWLSRQRPPRRALGAAGALRGPGGRRGGGAGGPTYVHQTPDETELAAIRRSNETGLPYGERSRVDRLCRRLKLDLTIRSRGRPPKGVRSGK